jgi:hypothetical protein
MAMDFDWFQTDVCVYWQPDLTSGPSEEAQTLFLQPVQITCRWQDVAEVIMDRTGRTIMSKSKILTTGLGDDGELIRLKEQGVLWHGRLEDVADLGDPFKNEDAQEIQSVRSVPDIENENKLYVVFC